MKKQKGVFLVLAAGKGTRMKSPLAKVLHPLAGRPMICFLLDRLKQFSGMRTVCVVGHDADAVRSVLPEGVESVLQWPPRGTGDAVRVARRTYARSSLLVVLPGDAPLVSPETLRALLECHRREKALATVLTAEPEDLARYGRVVMDATGGVQRIVEAVDADAETLSIRQINTGIYVFDPKALLSVIGRIGTANRKKEFYLTDVIELLAARGRVAALNAGDPGEVAGVNSLAELARMEGWVQKHVRGRLMDEGVHIPHPQSVYVEPGVIVKPGARLLPGAYIVGRTTIGSAAVVGPNTYISNSVVGARVKVGYSVVEDSSIGDDVSVGPFAHLRMGTRLEPGSRVGNFVETKATRLGRKARALHLTYLGDTTVGEDANIGAGTITCNYDGYAKHPTTIGARAFIGSNTAMVAPVRVGRCAVVGAGSVITQNVPADSLAITRAPQINKKGWARRQREIMKKRMQQKTPRRKQ